MLNLLLLSNYATPSGTNKQPLGEPASQTTHDAMSVENSAQPSAAEQLNTAPSITNKQPSGEPASQTTPEAMAADYAARPEAATLTDEFINNRHLCGFEVVKETNLGLIYH